MANRKKTNHKNHKKTDSPKPALKAERDNRFDLRIFSKASAPG